jgi:DNA-binding NtrC family response regulator
MADVRVLVIDDDTSMLELARYHLEDKGFSVALAETGAEGLRLATTSRFDIALTDYSLPDVDGVEVVRRLKELSPETEIIVVTGYGSVDVAIEATKAGAFYFVEKPVDFDELMILVDKALERGSQAAEIARLRGRLAERTSYVDIIGGSKAMQSIYELIDGVAESDANILIIGESGTGKELIANAIHYKSLRAKRPFVKVNCAALPKELIESELFGHTRGAFTGASTDKKGLIGQADTGSLLLDEITEMPLELQPKLLRVLQERAYRQLGSEKTHPVDFRLISATNRDPRAAVADGQLREDLYYRINTIEVHVPPLRDRADDIQRLAEHFLQLYAEKYNRPVTSISQSAYEHLFAYRWPGNVRELQNALERAVLLVKGNSIDVDHLPFAHKEIAVAVAAQGGAPAPPPPPHPASIEELGRAIVALLPDPREGAMADDVFKRLESIVVGAALDRTGGNKQAAAQMLGVYRPRLYSMLRKYNLIEADDPDAGEGAPPDTGEV